MRDTLFGGQSRRLAHAAEKKFSLCPRPPSHLGGLRGQRHNPHSKECILSARIFHYSPTFIILFFFIFIQKDIRVLSGVAATIYFHRHPRFAWPPPAFSCSFWFSSIHPSLFWIAVSMFLFFVQFYFTYLSCGQHLLISFFFKLHFCTPLVTLTDRLPSTDVLLRLYN